MIRCLAMLRVEPGKPSREDASRHVIRLDPVRASTISLIFRSSAVLHNFQR